MSQKKIVVLKQKQLIYGAIFLVLFLVLVIFLVSILTKNSKDSTPVINSSKYIPGIYSSEIALNDINLNLEIIVDKEHINSIRIVNLNEAVATMFPLIEPAMNDIAEQLYNDIHIDALTISDESKYTKTLLVDAIKKTLHKAEIKDDME